MRNITVTIPDDAYRRARVWAAERDTSLSAVVKYLLETMPGIKRSAIAFPNRNSNPANTTPAVTSPREALNKCILQINIPSGAKAHVDFAGFMYGLKPVPFKTLTKSEFPKVSREILQRRFIRGGWPAP